MGDYFCPLYHPFVRLLSLDRDRGNQKGTWDLEWDGCKKDCQAACWGASVFCTVFPRTDLRHSPDPTIRVESFGRITYHGSKTSNICFHHISSSGAQTFQEDKNPTCCWDSQPQSKHISLGFMCAELFWPLGNHLKCLIPSWASAFPDAFTRCPAWVPTGLSIHERRKIVVELTSKYLPSLQNAPVPGSSP